MLRWDHLREWGDFIEACSYLHEHDGYPSRSKMPAAGVRCLSPTVQCIEAGAAIFMRGFWLCAASDSAVPPDYDFERPCPARGGAAPVLLAQVSADSPSVLFCEDREALEVLEWLKRTLAALGSQDGASAPVARAYLHDGDITTSLEELEALGSELLRRLPLDNPYRST